MTAVRLQRVFAASPARVFRAWLNPEVLVRWAAPDIYDAARAEVDPRVGGHYRVWHVDADGRDVGGFEAEILELVPDERLVLGFQFVGPDRAPIAEGPSLLTITLRPVPPDACELTLVHDRLDDLIRRRPSMADDVRSGWTGTLGRLDAALTAGG